MKLAKKQRGIMLWTMSKITLFIFMLGLVTVFYHFLIYTNTITLQEAAKNTAKNMISKLDEVRFSTMTCKEKVIPVDYRFRAGETDLSYLIRIEKTKLTIGDAQEEKRLSVQIRTSKDEKLLGASDTMLAENEKISFYKCPYRSGPADDSFFCQKELEKSDGSASLDIYPSEKNEKNNNLQSSYVIIKKGFFKGDETKQGICIVDCFDTDQRTCLKAIRTADACEC